MTSAKAGNPPSSPPIFRPWQLHLPQPSPHLSRKNSHRSNKDGFSQQQMSVKTRNLINEGASGSTATNGRDFVHKISSNGSLKRRLDEDVDAYKIRFQKTEDPNNKEVKRFIGDSHSEISRQTANISPEIENHQQPSILNDHYRPTLFQNQSGLANMPLVYPGFPFPSPLAGLHLLPGMERITPSIAPSGASSQNSGGIIPHMNGAFLGSLPGPSVLPGMEGLSGPLVPLMDVLVPASEVERVCAKRPRPKRFGCSECGSAFSNKGQLKGHLRIHTGERPFACGHQGCGKRFTRNEELTRHRRIHSGARPFPCPLCDKRFGRKDHLKKHIRTHQKQTVVPPQPLLLHHLHHLHQQIHHHLQ